MFVRLAIILMKERISPFALFTTLIYALYVALLTPCATIVVKSILKKDFGRRLGEE